jgi:anti-sigma regulatory factor (Ser/Thr protein kinase)
MKRCFCATTASLQSITDFLQDMGVQSHKAILAVNELVANIILHSKAGSLSISIEKKQQTWVFEICDDGIPYDINAVEASLPAQPQAEGGYGIYIIKQFVRQIVYSRSKNCNHNSFEFGES